METSHSKTNSGLTVGILFILVGSLWMANNFDLLSHGFKKIVFTWQMFLIALGGINLISSSNKKTGSILIAIGTLFLVPKLVNIPISWSQLIFPSVFIVVGFILLLESRKHFGGKKKSSKQRIGSKSDFLSETAIFGGGNKVFSSEDFQGGEVVTIFGGSKIDLRDCRMQNNSCEIEVTSIMGGFEIIVPQDWNVSIKASAVFGGINDKRSHFIHDSSSTQKTLIISGTAIFGGGDIRN